MNGVIELVVLLASTLISGDYVDYDFLGMVDERTMPPDLVTMLANKTDEELAYEECMAEYVECIAFRRPGVICATSKIYGTKSSYETICEMNYENCKLQQHAWEYLHDGGCQADIL